MQETFTNRFDEIISVGDAVMFEMHGGSPHLYPAYVTKIVPNGVWLREIGADECTILVDPFNIYKARLPKHKKNV